MKFFDGLYPYEVVLLVLGVLLFFVLTIALLGLVVRGKSYTKLLSFFIFPILMIGYPGIKSIEISGNLVKIEKYSRDLQENPIDRNSRQSLEKEVASVSDRSFADPAKLTTIARAQIALGNNAAAEANVKKALNTSPQLPAALELEKRIELDRNLATLTSHVEQNPADIAAKAKLADTVSDITRLPIASAETITELARAQKVLGDQSKAREYVDKALTIKPSLTPAIQLKRQIKTGTVPPVSDNR